MPDREPVATLTPALAQEIAGETSAISGLNVLITDREAMVIGSGDTARVGTVHEASVEVLRTLQPATHSAAQARTLRGVRPGITLPIMLDSVAVGTVGLTGSPARVRRFGRMVQRQTEILLRESVLLRTRMLRERALQDLVQDIAFFDADVLSPAAIEARAAELGLNPRLPRAVIVVEVRAPEATADRRRTSTPRTSPLHTLREAFPNSQDAVAEMTAGSLAVLHSSSPADQADLVRHCDQLVALMRERHGLRARVGFGQPASDINGLHESYADAVTALRLGADAEKGSRVFPVTTLRTQQLLGAASHHARTRFVEIELGRVRNEPDWPALRDTVIAWCESGFNLVRAAARLRIHRNTLIYRLDKITRLAGRPVRDPVDAIEMYLGCLTERVNRSLDQETAKDNRPQ
jgi:carbohydrate diacid regulator